MEAQASSSWLFIGNIMDNMKSETCKVIEFRNRVVVDKEVENNSEGGKSEGTNDGEVRGYTFDQFIEKNSPFRRTKKQILNEPNLDILDYIEPPYSILKKNKKRRRKWVILKSSWTC